MKKALCLALVLVVALASGCATVEQKLKPYASTFTEKICAMDPLERQLLRQEIDGLTYPNKIRVECGEDEIK